MTDADSLQDPSDHALLRHMAGGDRDALARLYRNYHGRLARFLSRLTRRPDIIEEAINDCFWIVWQKAGEFRGESQVSTWIMGIAYRCGLKSLRQHGDDPVDDSNLAEEPGHADHPDEDRELRDWLGKGLARLSADQRAVVELVYGMGYRLEDVAAIVGCPLGTIKARLFHARVKLRNVLPALAGDESPYTESMS